MNKRGFSGGTGAGSISLMLVFTVVCLTIFAVLSFQAAYSNDQMIIRSAGFTQEYYAADSSAKRILAQLDGIAAQSAGEFSFEESFIQAAGEIDGAQLTQTAQGVRAEISVKINENQTLVAEVIFSAEPAESRYSIISWQSVSADSQTDSGPAVWDGGDLTGRTE